MHWAKVTKTFGGVSRVMMIGLDDIRSVELKAPPIFNGWDAKVFKNSPRQAPGSTLATAHQPRQSGYHLFLVPGRGEGLDLA